MNKWEKDSFALIHLCYHPKFMRGTCHRALEIFEPQKYLTALHHNQRQDTQSFIHTLSHLKDFPWYSAGPICHGKNSTLYLAVEDHSGQRRGILKLDAHIPAKISLNLIHSFQENSLYSTMLVCDQEQQRLFIGEGLSDNRGKLYIYEADQKKYETTLDTCPYQGVLLQK